jgi:transcriptional regulator GlxA family with amidase domain
MDQLNRRGLLQWASCLLVGAAARDAAGAPAATPVSGGALRVPADKRLSVAFLLGPGAEVVDFAGPWGVFEYVSVPGLETSPFHLFTVAESLAPVKVSGGLRVVPDSTLKTAPQPHVVVVPAQGEPSPAVLAWLKRVSEKADVTMSVCNGVFLLAKAGLLDGKVATAHHGGLSLLAAEFPAITVKRGARFVDAGNLSSAGGLTSGIDLALHVVERYFGRAVAEQTAEQLEYQGQGWRDPNSNQAYAQKPVSTPGHPICPVCEMEVDPATALTVTWRGQTQYFCSADCKKHFEAAPARFLGPQ